MYSPFIDKAEIFVKAGNGGDGATSFTKSKGAKHLKANGGDGGRGGDIIVVADENLSTLLNFQYKKHFYASSGKKGGGNNKKGKDGEACIIKVPPGTIVKKLPEGFILRDLYKSGSKILVAKGGLPGKGNRGAKAATCGQKGECLSLSLELKILTDVGLIGYPNSGKSTFISQITNARPKIANYPFTTKSPIMGLAIVEDKEFIITEIPGIIKNSYKGAGLGMEFLKHIERAKLLIYILDADSKFVKEPFAQLSDLFEEIRNFNPDILKKPYIICLNKIDLLSSKDIVNIYKEKIKNKVYPISALKGDGMQELLGAVAKGLSLQK